MPYEHLSLTIINAEGQTEFREITMSYGLLNALVRIVGDPSRAAAMDLDPDLAIAVLTTLLVPRSPTGKPLVPVDQFEVPGLGVEEAYKAFDFVKENVLGFFVKRLKTTLTSIEGRKDILQSIGQSLAGISG